MAYDRYLIPGTDTLKNLAGLTDQQSLASFEREVTAIRSFGLLSKPIKGNFDFEHLKKIHRYLFQDVFEWAGEPRSVYMDKGNTRFEWPERIENSANRIFCGLRDENHLKNYARAEFINQAAHFLNEINILHPFREGNGRTQRAFMDILAAESGYAFRWGKITSKEMVEASIYGYAVSTSKFEKLLGRVLVESTKKISLKNVKHQATSTKRIGYKLPPPKW